MKVVKPVVQINAQNKNIEWDNLTFNAAELRLQFMKCVDQLINALKRNALQEIPNLTECEGVHSWEFILDVRKAITDRLYANVRLQIDYGSKIFSVLPSSLEIATSIIRELVMTHQFSFARDFAKIHDLEDWYKVECQIALQNIFCDEDRSEQLSTVHEGSTSETTRGRAIVEKSGIPTSELVHPSYVPRLQSLLSIPKLMT